MVFRRRRRGGRFVFLIDIGRFLISSILRGRRIRNLKIRERIEGLLMGGEIKKRKFLISIRRRRIKSL